MSRDLEDSLRLMDAIRKATEAYTKARTENARQKAQARLQQLLAADAPFRQEQQRQREETRRLREDTRLYRDVALQVIDVGYRRLATRVHPDHGGSTETMARLNRMRAVLQTAAKRLKGGAP